MHQLQVHINGIVVFAVPSRPDFSMMRGHQLMNKFCVRQLCEKGVDAAVTVVKENGESINLVETEIKNGSIIVQSKMNDPAFEPPPAWFDDILEALPIKNEYD